MPAWSHRDAVRFWESNGGAGPRGTPTISNGRIYTFGATGILNAMDARSGALVWSRNVVTDIDSQVPTWGIASSPLVIEGPLNVVIVGASGTLAAYDLATGKPRWVGPRHSTSSGGSYSSPQRVTIDGVEQVVLLSEAGATSVAPRPMARCSGSTPCPAVRSFSRSSRRTEGSWSTDRAPTERSGCAGSRSRAGRVDGRPRNAGRRTR